MFRRRRCITISDLPKYLAKGYGQGEGANYQPMIHVQDFPSRGWRTREIGIKTGRQHDYLSNLELYYHYILDWSKIVIDFREQFPLLPLERTLEIAKQIDVRHPSDRQTGEPTVMTTDFLVNLPQSIGSIRQARTIKLAKELDKKRTVEKFEIERRYWLAQGVNWAIVTEHEINKVLVDNVKWIHKFQAVSSLTPLTKDDIREIAIVLTKILLSKSDSLSNIALMCDVQLGLEAGQSLSVARHLIGSRQWHVDMTKPINPLMRLELLGKSSFGAARKKGATNARSKKHAA